MGDTLLEGSGDGDSDCERDGELLTLALPVALADTLPLMLAEGETLPETVGEAV